MTNWLGDKLEACTVRIAPSRRDGGRQQTWVRLYWLEPQVGRESPVSGVIRTGAMPQSKTRRKMPKLKTHSGAAKRFSKTGTGKIKRGQTKTRHILTSKSPKVKRKLGRTLLVSDGDYKKVARMIPYA
jgi:large subunit ribosomal protein L35